MSNSNFSNLNIVVYNVHHNITIFNAIKMQKYRNISNSNRFICDVCEKTFAIIFNKNKHCQQHVEQFFVFNCMICNRFFRRQNHLRRHMKIHVKNFNIQFFIEKQSMHVFNLNVFSTRFYIKHSEFQRVFKNFRERHNRRFSRTFCFHCEILMFDENVR